MIRGMMHSERRERDRRGRDREIMRRSMIDGQTYEAIAEAMDISSRTVGNRVRKWRPTVTGHLHF